MASAGKYNADGMPCENLRLGADINVRTTRSADELIAGELQSVQVAEDGDGDLVGAEEFVGGLLQVLGGDGVDALDEFVETVEAVEIHFLTSQVRHARSGGFERQHQAAFELVLGAAQLFFRTGLGF